MNNDNTIALIQSALSFIRLPAAPGEYDVHAEVARALDRAGIEYMHEYRLAPRCRIDFLVGRVGIEVKKGRPAPGELKRQLARYLASPELESVIVVTQRAVPLPDKIGGKAVYQIALNRNWGVSLP